MKNKNQSIREELSELKMTYGHSFINMLFASLEGYKNVRSYTSYKEVKKEIELLIIE
jgi:hypothetical protein